MTWNPLFKVAVARTAIGKVVGRIPFVEKGYARHALWRSDHAGLFTGVYDSYAAAHRDIPPSRHQGWDNEQSASLWLNHIDHMQPSAYAPFFWLSGLLQEGTTIIDFGGSIGLSYYSYVKRRKLPSRARWIVVEVPHLVAAGEKIAERENATQLEFVNDLSSTPPVDILFSAGTLQYIDDSGPGLLEKLPSAPAHILLNKLPLTKAPAYWTLQNFGPAISPYKIYNEGEFLGYFESAGYVLRDRWAVPELSCDVPFHPQLFVPQFSGLYFQKPERPLLGNH
jgi:putative methyltransferase (TIGR04325 family)